MKKFGTRAISLLCALSMLLALILVPGVSVQAATNGLDLSAMQIVLPSSPTKVEQTAASELQTYLYKITGVNPAIVTEGNQTGNAIFIGQTAWSRLKGVTYPTEGDENGEAWTIQAISGSLYLCGAPTRGVLYAVYHLLEDVLGVRWWNQWEEYVPEGDAIVPADYNDSGVPALEYREIFAGGWNQNSEKLFRVRNRLNGSNIYYADPYYGNAEYYGLPRGTHTFDLYFPADFQATDAWLEAISSDGKDFATNPEWYALIDGARNSAQLCLTNTDLQTEFANRLIKSIAYCYAEAQSAGRTKPSIFAVVPNDNSNFCECATCQSEISTYGLSGYVLRFVNILAEAVTEAGYTDAILEMAAYSSYKEAPQGGVVPADNVQIRFADSSRDILHGLEHDNNAESLTWLEDWASITTNNIYNWQYVVNYNNNGVVPSMFYYGDEFAAMMEQGVNGWFAEQEHCINADFWDMKQWLLAKLMEEPVTGQAYADLMDEFIYGYYGQEAGGYIRQYLYHMHERAEATNVHQGFGATIIDAQWLTVQDIITCYDYFEKAFAAAGNDATLLRRLRSARSGFDRVIVENFARWESEAASAGLTLTFTQREVGERIYQTINEQKALRSDYYTDEPGLYTRYDNYSEVDTPLPDALSGVAREHMIEYTTEDFRAAGYSYCSIVDDTDSLLGSAYKCDTANATGNTTENYNLRSKVPIYTFNGESEHIGTVSRSSYQYDSGYQLYSFDWTIPSDLSVTAGTRNYVYIGTDWGLQIDAMFSDLVSMAGKTIKVYLSMKVEGSYSYPVYYIDRIILLTTPGQLTHNYVTTASAYVDQCKHTCTACGDVYYTDHTWNTGVITVPHTATTDGYKSATCSGCGKTATAVIPAHSQCIYTDYVYNEDTVGSNLGTYTGTCVYGCGATHTQAASTDHVTSFTAQDFQLPYAGTFGDQVVTDSESPAGSAVKYASYPRRNENTNWLIMATNTSIMLATNNSGETFFDMKGDQLLPNQGYQLYKFSYEDFTISTDVAFVYLFGDWGLQNSALATALKDRIGKDFDLYLSMKITGDIYGTNLSDDSEENWPVYYIDRIFLVDKCTFGDYAAANNATCLTDGTQVATCTVCGMEDHILLPGSATGEHIWDAGVVSQPHTATSDGVKLFTCTACGTTKTEPIAAHGDCAFGNYVYNEDTAGSNLGTYTGTCVYDCGATHTWSASADHVSSFTAQDFQLPYAELFGDQVVTDSESPAGSAVKYASYPRRNENTNWLIMATNTSFMLGTNKSGETLFDMKGDQLLPNQGYQLYKFSYEDFTISTDNNFMYFFGDWGLQNTKLFNALKDRNGKDFDLYLSMKITGDIYGANLSDGSEENWPVYYIDRVFLVDKCTFTDYVSAGNANCITDGTQVATCTVCGLQEHVLDPGSTTQEHTWDEGVVTVEPTESADGEKRFTCIYCGATQTQVLPKTASIKNWSLVLDGNVAMNFYLSVSDTQAQAATVTATVKNAVTEYSVAELPVNESGQRILAVELNAVQMTEPVTVCLTTQDTQITKTYTVRQYADYILDEANGYDDTVKELVKQMLSYGAASQRYFTYRLLDLADSGLAITSQQIPATGGNVATSGAVDNARFYGASLLHKNKIALRFYFVVDSLDGLTFRVGDQQCQPEYSNGMYYLQIDNICPQNLDESITVSVTDGVNTQTVSYAPMDYLVRKNTGNTAALVTALYNYHLAAEAYTAQ